jgi:hypothetical protein
MDQDLLLAAARISDAVADCIRDHVTREVQTVLVELGTAARSQHDRLLEGVRRLDEAQSLSEVLDRLVEAAKTEAERVALFTVAGESLRSWQVHGFEPVPAISTTDAGILAEAVQSGQPHVEQGSVDILIPLAARSSGQYTRLLAPIRVGGRCVALLCAEQGDERAGGEVRPHWLAALEILARHAARTLEALTAQRTAQLVSSRPAAVRTAAGVPPSPVSQT